MKAKILEIIKELNDPKNDFANKSYHVVTETIKSKFKTKGDVLGYYTTAHKNRHVFLEMEYDEREWLFDLVWYKMDKNEPEIMADIPLVLESELSQKNWGSLKVDFDKLLVASSSTKVFITTTHDIEKKKEYIQKAINGFQNFNFDETLYVIVWDEDIEGTFKLLEFNKKV